MAAHRHRNHRIRKRAACWIVAASLLTATTAVSAEALPAVQFRYSVDPALHGTQGDCPGEEAVRRAVALRLGYAPWRADAARRMETTVGLSEGRLRGSVLLRNRDGKLIGKRAVPPGESCRDLVENAVLIMAIAISPTTAWIGDEPASDTSPASEASTADASPAADSKGAPSTEKTVRDETETRERRGSVGLYLGALGSFGAVPSVSAGVDAGAALSLGRWMLLVGARYDFPGERDFGEGRIAARQILGQVAACYRHRVFLCGGVSVGAFLSRGIGLEDAREETSSALFANIRLGTDIPLAAPLALRLYADLLLPVLRQRLLESGTDAVIWEMPPAGVVWGAALLFTIFDGNRYLNTIKQ